jgi:hypothetical protein
MNAADVLRGFHEAPLPPPAVDIDRAIRAGRRWRRRRTAGIASVLVGLVAAGSAATVPVLDGQNRLHTRITVSASTVYGGPINPADFGSVAAVVQNRLRAIGFHDAVVSIMDDHLVAVVKGQHAGAEIAPALAPGGFTVRKVINVVTPTEFAPSVPPAWRAGTPQAWNGQRPSQGQVLAVLGDAASAAAQTITNQTEAAANPALEPFRRLSPAEVAVLPTSMQLLVPQIGCAALDSRPADVVALEPGPVVACDTDGVKYLLDNSKLSNEDLASAVARFDRRSSTWEVELRFNEAGTPKWTSLTTEAYENSGGACIATMPKANDRDSNVCQVAFVVDNTVLSSPGIQAVLTNSALMTGGTETEVKQVAAELGFGRVPFALTIQEVVSQR